MLYTVGRELGNRQAYPYDAQVMKFIPHVATMFTGIAIPLSLAGL